MRTFFTSDTHYWHLNIIPYCERQFRSLDHMHETMIANWRAMVGSDDTVWHLGDVILGGSKDQGSRLREIMAQLPGHKNLIRGNHDPKSIAFYKKCGFEIVEASHWLNPEVLLIHNPEAAKHHFDRRPQVVLCGHVHDLWVTRVVDGIKYINVGVDVRGFAPVSAEWLGV